MAIIIQGGEAANWLDCTVRVPTLSSLTADQWLQAFLYQPNEDIQARRETPSTAGNSLKYRQRGRIVGIGANTSSRLQGLRLFPRCCIISCVADPHICTAEKRGPMQSSQGRVCYVSSLGLFFWGMGCVLYAQPWPQRQDAVRQEAPRQLLSPEELDALVAPIALYPDPLLSQALAATTYPLELVEAQQWLQQHPDLHGSQLVQAARQLNCDPSVQVMVAFPDVLRLLTQSIRWTTNVGNAVLAQQSDIMDAIQRLRSQAQRNGYLADSSQQVITTQPGVVQNVVSIQPADPQVIQVPAYIPDKIWGPPAVGEYPSLWYPAVSSGSGFGSPIQISSILQGLLNWSGWGWGLNWLTRGLFLNGSFFNSLGFPSFAGGYDDNSGITAWVHNPVHRLGVPYSNSILASRFGGSYRGRGLAGNDSNQAADPRAGTRQGFGGTLPSRSPAQAVDHRAGASEGWRFFRPHTGENAYRSAYRGGSPADPGYVGNAHSSGNMPGAGYRRSVEAPMNFRGDVRGSQVPPSTYFGSSDPKSTRALKRSYASIAAPRRSPKVRRSEERWPAGRHFSAPKSTGRFKAPKSSSRSSGNSSSKGRSSSHGKPDHRR